MSAPSPLPAAVVAVPFLAVGPILLSRSRPTLRETWTLAAAVLTLVLAWLVASATLDGVVFESVLGPLAAGTPLAFRADAMGALFALLASPLWLLASVYSVGYVRGLAERRQTRYFAAFAASVGATMGVALAGNLLTLFVFYELLTVATYPLVTHYGTPEARRAGRTYLAYTVAGGVAVLAGVALLHGTVGPASFVAGGGLGGVGGVAGLVDTDPLLARVAYALLVVGFGVKAAIVPLHAWLPEAMVAPTPVSGLLHAVAVVKSGVFGLARVVLFVFGVDAVRALGLGWPLAVAAAATMLVAGVLALRQDKLKRGLAYSTVSQLSYVVLGVALLSPTAVFGALVHLVAHAVMKLTLFLCAGVVYVETGVEYVGRMGRVWRRLPATMAAFAVASAGLVGIPGVAGFVSKWFLVLGALEAGAAPFAAVFLAAGLLKLLFFWPVLVTAARGRGAAAGFLPISGRGGRREVASDGGRDVGLDGGRDGASDGGRKLASDGGDVPGRGGEDAGDETHEPAWDRRTPATESAWLLVGPLVVTAAAAVVLGVVPDATPYWELARTVVREVFAGG